MIEYVKAAFALGVPTALVITIGAAVRERGWSDGWAAFVIGAGAVVAAVLIANGHDPDVSSEDVVKGTLLGALGGIALPAALLYGLGRLVANRTALVVAWLASLPVLGFWLFFVVIVTAGYVDCPPDAYECPL